MQFLERMKFPLILKESVTMRKIKIWGRVLAAGVAMLLVVGNTVFAASFTPFSDWGFNPSGAAGGLPPLIIPIDEITLLGSTQILNAAAPADGVPFVDLGVFQATSFQNDNVVIPATGLNSSYELTARFEATGVNNAPIGTVAQFTFDTTTVSLYLDTTPDFGATQVGPPFFGSDDGILIAAFDLIVGNGNLNLANPAGADGSVDILLNATFLLPGVWFSPSLIDLSTLIGTPSTTIFLDLDVNNDIQAPSANILSEFGEISTSGAPFPAFFGGAPDGSTNIYARHDGSVAPGAQVVPEPSTVLLFGSGLIAVAFAMRRRKVSAASISSPTSKR